MISPKQSGVLIARDAKHIKIKREELNKLGDILTDEINNGKLSLNNFVRSKFHPKPEDPHVLEWIFVVNCLSFALWTNIVSRPWSVGHNDGYFGLCAAIDRAIKEDIDILNPQFYSTVTKQKLREILRGRRNIKIPLLHERMKSLNDSGKILVDRFGGSFRNCVEQANHSALKLLNIIIENFKFFRDEAEYNGSKVTFYKRAQMLITDIWVCFKNQGIGYFTDMDELSAGACYRIPQTLLYYNVFEYRDELWEKIRSHTTLRSGSEEEVEIRGCTVHAVELLCTYIRERLQEGRTVNCTLIDHFLWSKRREVKKEIEQRGLYHHRTRWIYY